MTSKFARPEDSRAARAHEGMGGSAVKDPLTMTRREARIALIAKIASGEQPMPDLQVRAIGVHPDNRHTRVNGAFHGSIDHAMALHEAVLPGWGWHCGSYGARVWEYPGDEWRPERRQDVEMADSPARAWLLVILRALLTQEDGE